MKKNTLICGAMAMMLAVPALANAALTVPWTESFDNESAFNAFTVIDANGDGKKWEFNANRARISYNSNLKMDDWLISPAIQLAGGKNYKFNIDAAMTNWGPESFEVKVGNAPTVQAMTISVIPVTDVNSDNFVTYSGEFQVPQTGEWYIGVHGCSEPDMLYLTVDNLMLTEGTSQESPSGLADFTVTADPTGLNKVTLTGILPSVNVSGSTISNIENVEVFCDKNLIATVTEGLVPGTRFTYIHEDAANGQHTYTAVVYADGARGAEVSNQVFVGPGVPTQVPYLAVGEFTPGDITIRWSAPTTDTQGHELNPDLVTYKVVRYEVMEGSMYYEEDIDGADNVTGLEYVHHAIDADKGQMFTAYGVKAKTSAGTSTAAKTPLFPVGTPYAAPFVESFAWGNSSTIYRSETVNYVTITPSWDPASDSGSNISSYDGDGGYLAMSALSQGDCARYYTGKIDISALTEPQLSFYVYNYFNGQNSHDLNNLDVYISDGTRFVLCKELLINDLPVFGWNRVTVDLASYMGKTIQIAFESTVNNYTSTAIDRLSVTNGAENDLVALSVELPARITLGVPATVKVRVENAGTNVANGYTVDLYRDGQLVQTAQGTQLLPAGVNIVEFSETVPVFVEPGEISYYAVVNFGADSNTDNNESPSATTVLVAPAYPVPTALSAETAENGVQLSWTAPELSDAVPDVITDDFESYPSFTQTMAGEWLFVDNDGVLPGKLEGLTFPGIHDVEPVVPVSFWVMDANVEGGNQLLDAHSGARYLAQIFNFDDSQCDDWAISPRLYGAAQTISFYAKSYSQWLLEDMEILYSTSGTELSDFTSALKITSVPNTWTKYEVALPEGAVYFALRCTSKGCYMLFIDDVTYQPASGSSDLEIIGYNVYRNRELITTEPVTATTFTDTALPLGHHTHTYNVTAIYNRGESIPSNECIVEFTSLNSISSGSEVMVVPVRGGIRVSTPEPCTVEIYTTDGRVVSVNEVTAGTTMMRLSQGLYIIRAGATTCPVAVK